MLYMICRISARLGSLCVSLGSMLGRWNILGTQPLIASKWRVTRRSTGIGSMSCRLPPVPSSEMAASLHAGGGCQRQVSLQPHWSTAAHVTPHLTSLVGRAGGEEGPLGAGFSLLLRKFMPAP